MALQNKYSLQVIEVLRKTDRYLLESSLPDSTGIERNAWGCFYSSAYEASSLLYNLKNFENIRYIKDNKSMWINNLEIGKNTVVVNQMLEHDVWS